MSEPYEFDAPSRVTVGTVGIPGQRVFLLQASQSSSTITVKLEKQQVAALASHLGELLQDLVRPGHLPEGEELDLEPFDEVTFVVGTIAVAYDGVSDRLIVLVDERVDEDTEPREVRLSLTREQAAALAIRGTSLVESGRPPCPLCGFPIDPRGHACPRTNGHRAPTT